MKSLFKIQSTQIVENPNPLYRQNKRELKDIDIKLKSIQEQSQLESRPFIDVFQGFSSLDTANKKHVVNLVPPVKVDFQTGDISLEPNTALSKILKSKKQQT